MRKKAAKIFQWFFLIAVLFGMVALFFQIREMTSCPEKSAQMKQVFVR
ncbi:MAG: hypothetical protein BWY44_01272 [Candidatus Omnitrophica bacterium ADurb.Bin292]|nr:MAG: hypothetical protein BWY44_01272 [Candidatus Omnitrophica bacterium ADurb.Bin292]